jgi:anti-sigma factor RsiW
MRPNCSDIEQALSLFLSGELPEAGAAGATRAGLEEHLASCEACARLKARFERVDTLLRTAPVPMPSRDDLKLMMLRAQTIARSPDKAVGRGAGGTVSVLRQPFLAAAALFVALLIPTATYFIVTPKNGGLPGYDAVATTFDVDF